MTNLYESDDFNIISVRKAPKSVVSDPVEFAYYHVIIQRLPLSNYSELTEMCFDIDSIGDGLPIDEFITAIIPNITTRLAEYDSAVEGSINTPLDTTTFLQIYN